MKPTLYLILMAFISLSFTNSNRIKHVVIKGNAVDLMTEQSLDSFEFLIGASNNWLQANSTVTTDENGRFSTSLAITNNATGLNISAYQCAYIELINYDGRDTIDLGDLYFAKYNNQFKHLPPSTDKACQHNFEQKDGDAIDDILIRTYTKDYKMTSQLDTVKLGESPKDQPDSTCWFSYVSLSFTRDLNN